MLVHYSLIDTGDLLLWLHFNTNWRMVFVDDTAALFVRVPAGEISPYPEVDPDDERSFASFGEPGAVDRLRRFARTQFYSSLRRHEAALALWRETLERYPTIPQGDVVLALLLHRNGFESAAEAIYRRLLAERPDDPVLQLQIGDLRYAAGDLEQARDYYDAALALDRHSTSAMQRRAHLAESQGDADTAVTYYLQIVAQSSPTSPVAMLARGRLRALGVAGAEPPSAR